VDKPESPTEVSVRHRKHQSN